jgi:hypothetical protein
VFIIRPMATKETAKKKTTAPAKAAPKKTNASKAASTVKTSKTVKVPASVSRPITEKNQSANSVKVRKGYILLVLVVVVLGALLYFFRGLFVAAVVNGQPISRMEIVKESEKQSGKQALTTLVRNSLIEQEAQKKNVTVSDQEVNDEIKKLESTLSKQGQKLDQVLEVQGMKQEDLRRLIRLDKLVAKMVGKDVTVSDKEVSEYLEKNKALLPQDQKEEDLKKTVKEQLKQQKINEKVKTWLEDLQNKANVIYFVQY